MQTVNISGFGPMNFPDEMSKEEIQAAIDNDIYPKLQQAKEKPDTGFTGAMKSSFAKMKGEAALTAGKVGLINPDTAENFHQEQEAEAKRVFKPTEEGWLQAPWQNFKETLGGSLPYMAAPLVAGGIGTAAAGAAPAVLGGTLLGAGLGTLGAFGAGAAQFTGSNLARQMDEGKSYQDADVANAALAALPQSALDTLSLHMIPGISRIFGQAGKKITQAEAKRIAEQGLLATTGSWALKTGKTMGIEGGTEAAQQVFERLQAHLSLTDEKAKQEYFDNFIGGAVLGGVLGGFGHMVSRPEVMPNKPEVEGGQLQEGFLNPPEGGIPPAPPAGTPPAGQFLNSEEARFAEQQRRLNKLGEGAPVAPEAALPSNVNPVTPSQVPPRIPTAPLQADQMARRIDEHAKLLQQAQNEPVAAQRQALEAKAAQLIGEQQSGVPAAQLLSMQPLSLTEARQVVGMAQNGFQHPMLGSQEVNPSELHIVPHPSTPNAFAIEQRGVPEAYRTREQAPQPMTAAQATQRIEEAKPAERDVARQQDEQGRQAMITRAMQNIEARNGVASPQEAETLRAAGLGQPYNRIDPNLAPKGTVDQQLTDATGIQLQNRPRESGSVGAAQTSAQQAADQQQQQQMNAAQESRGWEERAAARQAEQASPIPESTAPAAPDPRAVIDAYNTPPALRSAAQVALLNIAKNRINPSDLSALQMVGEEGASLPHTMERIQRQLGSPEAPAAKVESTPEQQTVMSALETTGSMRTAEQTSLVNKARELLGEDEVKKLEKTARQRKARRTKYSLAEESTVPEENRAKTEEAGKKLVAALKRFGLERVGLRIVKSILDGAAEASFANRIINIAMNVNDPMGVMRHEAIHALKEMGAFTDAEWKMLTDQARNKWIKEYISPKRMEEYQQVYAEENGNLDGFDEYIAEEAIADAFRDHGNIAGAPRTLMNRIASLLKAIRNAFNGQGFKTAEDIFRGIERGEFKPDSWKATPEDRVQAREYERVNGIAPYLSEGQLAVPATGVRYAIKGSYTDKQIQKKNAKLKTEGEYGNHPVFGIPMNANGTVTLYVPTNGEMARRIANEKKLFGDTPESNRIYLTNESDGQAVMKNPGVIAHRMDGANVLVQVDPSWLELEAEHADGRKDFSIVIAEGNAFAKKMAQTKMFTLFADRNKGISKTATFNSIGNGITKGVDAYRAMSTKEQAARLKQAKDLLRAEHNVGILLTENGKLQKSRLGEFNLKQDGNSIASMGLGLASAQKINDKLSTCINSARCEGLCLGETSGQNLLYGGEGSFRAGPRLSQYLKTEAMVMHPEEFGIALYAEIESLRKWAAKETGTESVKVEESDKKVKVPKQVYEPAIRLNVTSDFPPPVFESIIHAFSSPEKRVNFYDYTKLNTKSIGDNHHLTYSSTGALQRVGNKVVGLARSKSGEVTTPNWDDMQKKLDRGFNVAMAFSDKKHMPKFVVDEKSGKKYQVWNGDLYDARYLDPKREDGVGMIVGLTNKDRTGNPAESPVRHNGFFVAYNPKTDGDTVTIEDQEKLAKEAEKTLPPVEHKVGMPGKAKYSLAQQKKIMGEASWSKDRINKLINEYAYTNDEADTKAYATFMSPQQLLNISTNKKYQKDVLEKENKPLDTDKLTSYGYPMWIDVNPDSFGGGRITATGHEGRHRMMALRDVGVDKVPVVIKYGRRQRDAKPIKQMLIDRQNTGHEGSYVENMIPISYKYAKELNEVFGNPDAQVRFSLAHHNTPAFKNYFDGSKIVNEDGSPFVLYHGTGSDIHHFIPSEDGMMGRGIYMSGDSDYASHYANHKENGNVVPVYASIKNPYYIERDPKAKNKYMASPFVSGFVDKDNIFGGRRVMDLSGNQIRNAFKKAGYDGIVLRDATHPFIEVVAFDAPQIKSAISNTGKYGKDKKIRYSLTQSTPQVSAGKAMVNAVSDMYDSIRDGNARTSWRNGWVDSNSSLAKALSPNPLFNHADGTLRADMINHAKAQTINFVRNALLTGQPIVNNDGTLGVHITDKNLSTAVKKADSLNAEAQRLGYTDGRHMVAEVARALRGEDILQEDVARRAKAQQDLADARNMFTQVRGMPMNQTRANIFNQIKEMRRKAQQELKLNREKMVKPADIAQAHSTLQAVPQIQEVLDIWKDVNDSLIDLWHTVGLLDVTRADELKSHKNYVPLFKSADDLEETDYFQGSGTGLKSTANLQKLKGGTHKTNIWENVDKHFARMIANAYENQSRRIAIQQLGALNLATITNDPNDKRINLKFKIDGKDVNAIAHNPNDVAGFQMMQYELNPVMKMFSGATKLLRIGALVNPMFWIKQLIRDPIHASLVAGTGIVTPFQSAAHFFSILANKSEGAKVLARHGVIGQYDSTVSIHEYLDNVGKAHAPTGNMSKLMSKVMEIHEASDAATRVAIYEQVKKKALAEGKSEEDATNFAVFKARESINFAVHGNSPILRNLRMMVPFLSAQITSLDTVYRALTGKNLSPDEKAEAKAMFISRALMLTALSVAYAAMYQDDDEYKKLPDYVRDNNWLIPTTDETGRKTFIKIPTPFEVGFLFKTLPEASIRYLSQNSTGKEVIASYLGGLIHNLPANGIPVPQVIKPALETITNFSFFNMAPIESLGDQGLATNMRGRNATEFSRMLSTMGLDKLGLSPVNIDYIAQGYLGELGIFSLVAASQMADATTGKQSPTLNSEQMTFLKSFMTDPAVQKGVSDFYNVDHAARQIVTSFNNLKKTGRLDEAQKMLDEPETKQAIFGEKALRKFSENMTKLRNQIEFVKNSKDLTPDQKRDQVNLLNDKFDQMAQQGYQFAKSVGLEKSFSMR